MNQISILEKDGVLSVVSKRSVPDERFPDDPMGAVIVLDMRPENPIQHQVFKTAEETDDQYKKAVKTSENNGWREIFRGEALNNPALS